VPELGKAAQVQELGKVAQVLERRQAAVLERWSLLAQ